MLWFMTLLLAAGADRVATDYQEYGGFHASLYLPKLPKENLANLVNVMPGTDAHTIIRRFGMPTDWGSLNRRASVLHTEWRWNGQCGPEDVPGECTWIYECGNGTCWFVVVKAGKVTRIFRGRSPVRICS